MMEYNPFSLKGKTILVTGASSGIGRAIAIECSKMGAKLYITARNEDRLKETLSKMCNLKEHKIIIADLLSEDGLQKIISELDCVLDGVVHSAGITNIKPFTFITKEAMQEVMNVNFEAPTILSQMLIKKKKVSKQSSIVFISSMSGIYISIYANSMYSASKAALNSMAKSMALELASKGIRVNNINPGMIDTNILADGVISTQQLEDDAKKYPLKRYGKPEEVAYAAIYLLSDASAWVTGSNMLIDGGLTLS